MKKLKRVQNCISYEIAKIDRCYKKVEKDVNCNSQKEQGITLVALVVTIVILLILAGITIATLFGDNGIINKAKKAKEDTEKSSENELDALNMLEGEMENAIKGNGSQESGWRQPDPLKPEITNGEITLKIGDYVDYDCTTSDATYTSTKEKTGYDNDQVFKANEYQYGWRVLGVDENKQLMLLSEDFAQPSEGGTKFGVRQAYNLRGQEGYVNGVDELNNICKIYGNGKGAVSARSINVDDINKITGYNPNNVGVKDLNKTGSGTKYAQNIINEYANNVKYTLLSNGIKCEPENGVASSTNSSYDKFSYYDEKEKIWKSLVINESVILKSTLYVYYPTTLTQTNNINETTGIANTSETYKLLFTNSNTGADAKNAGKVDNIYYWIATPYFCASVGSPHFGLRVVIQDSINYYSLVDTWENPNSVSNSIRPIVILNDKVQLKDSGTIRNSCKLYNLILPQD